MRPQLALVDSRQGNLRGQGSDRRQEHVPLRIPRIALSAEKALGGLAEGDTVLTTITSKALRDREAFMERMRGWNRIPGMEKKKK